MGVWGPKRPVLGSKSNKESRWGRRGMAFVSAFLTKIGGKMGSRIPIEYESLFWAAGIFRFSAKMAILETFANPVLKQK